MNECIICLCSVDLDVEEAGLGSTLTQDIPCKCIYSVHEICLNKWLNTKYSCPMCSTIPIGINVSSGSQDGSDNPREQLLNHNQVPSRAAPPHICIKCIALGFVVLFIWFFIQLGGE